MEGTRIWLCACISSQRIVEFIDISVYQFTKSSSDLTEGFASQYTRLLKFANSLCHGFRLKAVKQKAIALTLSVEIAAP